MKLAVVCESAADEAGIVILVEAILGRTVKSMPYPRIETWRGWQGVFTILPAVLTHAYYNTDAEGVVAVVDSDESPTHEKAHEEPGPAHEECRFCKLRATAARAIGSLRPVSHRPPLKTAFGLAVPAIEAWYRVGVDVRVRESAWTPAQRSGLRPYTKRTLKQGVYGTEHPLLEHATQRAIEEARRLVGILPQLEERFPNGFGAPARSIRSWRGR